MYYEQTNIYHVFITIHYLVFGIICYYRGMRKIRSHTRYISILVLNKSDEVTSSTEELNVFGIL